MATYLVMYQWYEFTSHGIIKATSEEQAINTFCLYVTRLENNYQLEKKYGYGGSVSPFHYDEQDEDEEPFLRTLKKFMDSEDRGTFTVIEIKEDTEGIITERSIPHEPSVTGFYNGEKE